MRTVLFGLDGATFTVLDHLISLGLMPCLERVYKQGARSKLLSTPLPITPQAWTSLATGRGMGHHGIHDFVRLEFNDRGVFARFNTSRDNHCETIWKYASRHGRRVTVLNYIGLAPPEPINGHSMPGFVPGRYLRRSSYPADLFKRLEGVSGFNVSILGMDIEIEKQALREMDRENSREWIRHHIEREQAWFGTLEHLMINEPSDLTAIVFDGVDKLQHLAYPFLDPAYLPKNPDPWEQEVTKLCHEYFQQIDRFLARTLEIVGNWGRVFIASDHGFTASTEILYINRWLQEKGYFRWKQQPEKDDCEAIFVDRLTQYIDEIDWDNTTAFALTPSCNGIYLRTTPEDYHAVREKLIAELLDLRGPDGGCVITEIKKREEWFPGPFMERAPDLTLTLRDYGLISVLNSDEVVVPRRRPNGTHHPDGVLIALGPGVRSGQTIERRNILDVAPLLLHSMGLEIPAEYEGSFPAEIYEAGYLQSDPARVAAAAEPIEEPVVEANGVEAGFDAEDETLVMERLRSLGYVE